MFTFLIGLLVLVFLLVLVVMIMIAEDAKHGSANVIMALWLVVAAVGITLLLIPGTSHIIVGGDTLNSLQDKVVNVSAGQDFKFQPANGFYYIDAASTTGLTVCDGNGCSGVIVGPDAGYHFVLDSDTNDTVVISPSQNATLNLIY